MEITIVYEENSVKILRNALHYELGNYKYRIKNDSFEKNAFKDLHRKES